MFLFCGFINLSQLFSDWFKRLNYRYNHTCWNNFRWLKPLHFDAALATRRRWFYFGAVCNVINWNLFLIPFKSPLFFEIILVLIIFTTIVGIIDWIKIPATWNTSHLRFTIFYLIFNCILVTIHHLIARSNRIKHLMIWSWYFTIDT